jgi:ABC-type bacteriocin/lantibiotic exporter with double-glycine peptidase domain
MKKVKLTFFLVTNNLIKKDLKRFTLLLLLILFQSLLVFASVIAIIPISEYLMDPEMKKVSKFTGFLNSTFLFFNITTSFWVFGFFFIFINLFKAIIEIFTNYFILKIKYNLLRQVYKDLLDSIFRAEWVFFSKIKLGSLFNTLSSELPRVGDTLGHITSLIAQIIQLLIYIAIPLYINFKMTIIVILISSVFFIFLSFLNKISYKLGLQNTQTANKTFTFLTESIAALKLIFSYSKQENTKLSYFKFFDTHVDITIRSQILSIIVTKVFLPFLMLAVVISVGFSLINGIILSEAIAVMWSLLLSIPVCVSIFQLSVSFKNFVNSFEQVEIIKKEARNYPIQNSHIIVKNFKKNISLKKVYFNYLGRTQLLKNININIQKNSITAIVGNSGSGKSTILDLIMGLQKPSRGNIFLDNHNLSKINLEEYRDIIGIVPQESFLLETSIKENLIWGVKNKDNILDKDIWNALRLSNSLDFIKELPKKLDTLISVRGSNLSGGQRQRLALARALIRKPKILVLDEATSSLDEDSENIIIKALKKIAKNTTIIIVTHKLSILNNVDKIFYVKNGRVVKNKKY